MKLDRRGFFQVTAAGGAVAGLDACAGIVPEPMKRRRRGPEKLVSTACGACPAGCGIAVRVVGNAVQIEGIEDHPINAGGVCPRGIAEIQNLYHSERLRGPRVKGASASWDDAIGAVAEAIRGAAGNVVIGVGAAAAGDAPLVDAMAAAWKAKVVRVELPYGQYPNEAMREMLGFGNYRYDLGRADCVLSLGVDWLQASPSPVEAQRAFAAIRAGGELRGFIATASGRLSTTAARGDLWIPVRPDQMARFGAAIYRQLESGKGTELAAELGIPADLIEVTAKQLSSRKRPVVVTDRSDPDTQRVGIALNQLLGAVDREGGLLRAATLSGPAESSSQWSDRFPDDVAKPIVVLLDANPVYLSRPDTGWAEGLKRASFVASVSSFPDETAATAAVVLPPSTPLETKALRWGSTFGGEGFASAGPAAVPKLYDTLDRSEILIRIAKAANAALPWSSTDEYIAAVAGPLAAAELFEEGGFVKVKAGGAVEGAVEGPARAPADAGAPVAEAPPERPPAALPTIHPPAAPPAEFPLALDLRAPLAFQGGLGSHLPYLHGLTDGGEREVWRSIVEVHPATAHDHGIGDGKPVWVESAHGKLRAIARVRQGIRPDTVAMAIGLGRTGLGIFADGQGANPLKLAGPGSTTFVQIRSAS